MTPEAGEGAADRRLGPAEEAGGAGHALVGEERVEGVEELERDMLFLHVDDEVMCIDSMPRRRDECVMRNVDDHPGWQRLFVPGRLTIGLLFPIEAYRGDTPEMRDQ